MYTFYMFFLLIKFIHRSHAFFFAAIFFLSVKPGAQIPIQQLPLDEEEAYIMLKEGTLDSATWELIGRYYEQPLNVPDGELKDLVNVFPEIGHDIPSTQEQLSSYEPWAEKDVRRFFSDFPEVKNLEPILSFETCKKPHVGLTGVAIHKYTETDPLVYPRFLISPNSIISVQGRIACSNTSARWQRRSLIARMPTMGTLTVGNFNVGLDNGLFTGYFPESRADTEVSQNWQYAGANAWNGVMYDSDIGDRVHGCMFIHRRLTETVYGIKCITKMSDHINCIAAGSHVMALAAGTARPDSAYYGDAGMTYNNGHWNAGAFAGAASQCISAVPLFLYAKNSSGSAGFNASYASIPAGLPSPRSALIHRFSEKNHQPDSCTGGAQILSLTCRLPVCYGARSMCGATYYYSPGSAAAEGYAGISGKAWLDYSVRYTFKASPEASDEYQTMTASFSRRMMQWLRFSLYGRCTAASGAYQSVFVRSTFGILPSSSLEVAPFLTVFSANDNNREIFCGVTQMVKLFEKTWSEIKIEVPLTKQNQDQWVLDAKANFYL